MTQNRNKIFWMEAKKTVEECKEVGMVFRESVNEVTMGMCDLGD